MNGIVILDKPMGMTSFKALGAVKRAYNTKKVGHTGTLDPDATGVLPALIGTATRCASLLEGFDKRYTAKVLLGVRTDTLDLSGKVLETKDVNVTEGDVEDAARRFVGEIEQVPPMYSAVSVGGRRLYDLAREGLEVAREKRRVNIYSIDILDISLPEITLDVRCSKGTYIRTLASDIGEALSCGGTVSSLRRTEAGIFTINDSHTPEEIEKEPEKYLLPTDSVFKDYEKIRLDARRAKMVKNGVPIYYGAKEGATYRIYDENGEFIALSKAETIETKMCLKMIKGFY